MRGTTFFASVVIQCNGKTFDELRHRQFVGRVSTQQADRFAMTWGFFIFLVNFGNWIGGGWNDFCYQLFLGRSLRFGIDFRNGQS